MMTMMIIIMLMTTHTTSHLPLFNVLYSIPPHHPSPMFSVPKAPPPPKKKESHHLQKKTSPIDVYTMTISCTIAPFGIIVQAYRVSFTCTHTRKHTSIRVHCTMYMDARIRHYMCTLCAMCVLYYDLPTRIRQMYSQYMYNNVHVGLQYIHTCLSNMYTNMNVHTHTHTHTHTRTHTHTHTHTHHYIVHI